jgi:2-(1,2-epoxy-1,2-dihydrophenyl)acetyl-CoA isomerase
VSKLAIFDRGFVRVLRLDRPERKNALDSELGWAIVRAVLEAARDDSVRVLAITGAGDAFSSGLDLSPGPGSPPETGLSRQEEIVDELGWVARFPLAMRVQCEKPVVAGVNGVAVGAGFSLAMSADIRIASSRARFLAGYARAGTSPDGGLTWTLPQAIGPERALRVLLEQEMIPASRALELGLVSELVDAEGFEDALLACCDRLAQVAPIAARQTKRMLGRATTPAALESFLREEIANARRGLDTEDGREAIQAIREKRPPVFRGR